MRLNFHQGRKKTRARSRQERSSASEEEMAQLLVFLASPAATFITGCTIKADGGASIWGEHWAIPDWRADEPAE